MRDSLDPPALRKLDAAIDDLAPEAFGFLERLVELPSTVGQEDAAQRAVVAELERLGFQTAVLPVPEDIGDDPAAGVSQASYAGRGNVAGHLVNGDGCRCFSTATSMWCRPRRRGGPRRRSPPAA